MALDPQIALGVQVPMPPNPLQTLTQVENIRALAEQRQALAEERQQQAQALVQKAKDTAAINTYLQQAGGDYDKAGDLAVKNGDGSLAQGLYKQASDKRKGIADALDAQSKASNAQLDLVGKITATMGDSPDHYQAGLTALNGIIQDPNLKQLIAKVAPPDAKPEDIPGIVSNLSQMQVTAAERMRQRDEFVKGFLGGDYERNLAGELALTPPEQRQGVLDTALALAPDTQTRSALRAKMTPLLAASPDVLNQLAMTPAERQAATGRTINESMTVDGKPTPVQLDKQGHPFDMAGNPIDPKRLGARPPASVLAAQNGVPEVEIKPGSREYRTAQDLADGSLTLSQFQQVYGSRSAQMSALKGAIYDTARQINPNFNPAQFEIGFKFAENPKVRQQVASIKNVESGLPAILEASDAAVRSGSPALNEYAVKPISSFILGGKKYSNFQTAVTAFADELSGALGYGSATDMSRDMGFNMTDMNQSPAVFRSNMQDIVEPFVARKKASLLGQMGPYNQETPSTGRTGSSAKDPLGIRKGGGD